MTLQTTPPFVSGDFAAWFEMNRADFLAVGDSNHVVQAGGAYLPSPFPMGTLDSPPLQESAIETFVVDAEGRCTATGGAPTLSEQWQSDAEVMAASVLGAAEYLGIDIAGPSYLTASLTPLSLVTDTPHCDIDQYDPQSGIDLVAIAASDNGPRLCFEPLKHGPVRAGLPIVFSEDIEHFADGTKAVQQAEAHRIVIFPQFAQLHSGPCQQDLPVSGQRNLFVFRATTVPRSG